MFLALFLGADRQVVRANTALQHHSQNLAASSWVGTIKAEPVPGGFVAWDRDSTHASVFHDKSGTTMLVRGGYLAGPDEWLGGGIHSTEADDAWGEFAALVIRSDGGPGLTASALADPAGSWPMYWARRDEAVVVTNDALFAAVSLGLTTLSSQASYELLAYGHSLGPDSTITGVSRLRPGERLKATATVTGVDSLEFSRAARHRYERTAEPELSLESLALNGLRAGAASIPVLRDGGFAHATVQLSGGMDSRLTAAVLAEQYAERPPAVTLDLSDPKELEIAAEVARRLGYPHKVESLAQADEETLRKGWLLTGGQVSPYAAAGNVLSYETAQRGPSGEVLLVGAWPGDCLIGSYIPLIPGMKSRVLRRVMTHDWANKRGRRLFELERNVTGAGRRRIARIARRRLARDLASASGSSAAQSISHWAMFTRQPNFSYLAPAMLTSHVLPITPLLSRPYLERLLQLTGGQILGKRFYRGMIARAYPDVAEVPIVANGRPITDPAPGVAWAPKSVADLYVRLPVAVQSAAHFTIGRFKRATSQPSISVEEDYWSSFLGTGESESTVAGNLEFHTSAKDDLHVRAIVRGLRWTREYLDQSKEAIGAWR